MRAAKRSHKAAIEDQQDIPAAQIREPNDFAADIGQFKIGSRGINGDLGHIFSSQTRKVATEMITIQVNVRLPNWFPFQKFSISLRLASAATVVQPPKLQKGSRSPKIHLM
jgi:hypothetical protein